MILSPRVLFVGLDSSSVLFFIATNAYHQSAPAPTRGGFAAAPREARQNLDVPLLAERVGL
jgi:hypothetical protein